MLDASADLDCSDAERLRECYERIRSIVRPDSVEPFRSVVAADSHRRWWRPERVRVLLLAESHVFTAEEELNRSLSPRTSFPDGLPRHFIRLVYCLGYGENAALDRPILSPRNSGTPQYWRLFYYCVNPVTRRDGLQAISVTRNRDVNQRLQGKLHLLNQLKAAGIWLLDACPTGLYRPGVRKLTPGSIDSALRISWDVYLRDVICGCSPEKLLIIGKGVEASLKRRIESLDIPELASISQPAAFLTSEQRERDLIRCYEFCSS